VRLQSGFGQFLSDINTSFGESVATRWASAEAHQGPQVLKSAISIKRRLLSRAGTALLDNIDYDYRKEKCRDDHDEFSVRLFGALFASHFFHHSDGISAAIVASVAVFHNRLSQYRLLRPGAMLEVRLWRYIMARISKTQVCGLLMTGALVGATVALLFAPKTGAQTRKDIRKFSRKTMDRLDDLQDDVRSQISDGYEHALEAFETVKEFVENGRERLQKLVKTA
jgi:gas vesicle protein